MAELLFFRDGELQMRAPLKGPTVLGRAAEADLVLPDRAVSRLQCQVLPQGGGWALVDRSGRGTQVSHRLATDHGTELQDGDEIRLGEFQVIFGALSPEAAEPEVTMPVSHASRRGKTGRLGREGAREPRRAQVRVRRAEGESVIPLRPEEGYRLLIGTDPEGPYQLELDDRFVSAEHCRLAFRGGQWVLTDLQSKNGTFVDRLRIGEAYLTGCVTIRVGETTLTFEPEAAAEEGPAEPLPGLVTRDPAMAPVVEQVRRLAPARVSVAIHGETGVGKEVIARSLHALSERAEMPFVALNCGALPKDLVESELFGHEKGAFTGADRARAGAFEEADGGTLFLDEVGDLPLSAQVKLLRVLESGEVRRLGSSKTEVVDVRLLSATHQDLMAAVERGAFREDLYYRLCVAPLEVPPLRRRVSDVMPLAEHFLSRLAPGEAEVTFSPSARAKLEAHAWPGNVRELRNVVQLALLQRRGLVVTGDDLSFRTVGRRKKSCETLTVAGRTLESIEKEAYRLAMERHAGDKKAAMEELGVARSTFFRKLEEFGLGGEER